MENSFSGIKTVGWLEIPGFPYISAFEAALIFAAALLVLLLILWLIFRKARLWYWKTNIQVDTLKSIDGRLQSVEDKLSQPSFRGAETEAYSPPGVDGEVPLSETVQENTIIESKTPAAVGRSGRIYTEAELELQIRE